MAEYKLYYFNFRGRAEIIRLVLAAAGQKYEDIRFSREQWPEYKPKAPFGQCPFIEIKEGSQTVTMAQSTAIARYIAKKFGMAGKNDLEAAILDMYADQLSDFLNEIAKSMRESDPEKKKEIEEKLKTEVIPTHLKFIEERLAKSGSGFLASSGLSWVDLYLYALIDFIPHKEVLLANFKHIKQNRDKVEANPGIANWLKVRPVTEM